MQNAVTDDNGLAQFKNVPSGRYTVKEAKAPEGYSISNQIVSVEINQSMTYDIGTIKDTKNTGSVQINKVGQDGKSLNGAEFTLYDSQGKAVKAAVSGY